MSTALKVCVIGAGAIGGLLGVRLAQAGADFSVVARGATLAALRDKGWRLQTADGDLVSPVRAVGRASELGIQDVVVIAVKAPALAAVADTLQPLLGPQTLVVPALNGVPWWFTDASAGLPVQGPLQRTDPQGRIAGQIPVEQVIGCVVYAACSSPAPGVARHNSGSRIVLGEAGSPAGGAATDRLLTLTAAFKAAGLDAEASTDIRTEVWKKLLGNACFNPVSLLTGASTDLLIDDPAIYALFTAMMTETLAVGRAIGVAAAIEPAARLAVTRKLGNVKTSMLQDAEAGRVVEVDAILGAVIELARCLTVATPACDAVYALARMRAATFGLLPG